VADDRTRRADNATDPPDWGSLRRRLVRATIRDSILLALVLRVPVVRRYRALFWRLIVIGSAIAVLYGFLKGADDARKAGRPSGIGDRGGPG
jgi:hypothetical protein